MAPTVYLVTGANRGIGLEIVTQLASRPGSIVFAACAYNTNSATALQKLAAVHPERVKIIKLASGFVKDNAAAVQMIRKVAGRLDVIIISTNNEHPREHWDANVISPHPDALFRQILPLLRLRGEGSMCPHTKKSKQPSNPPKFIVISSSLAVNFLIRNVHSEHGDDGLVLTDCRHPIFVGALTVTFTVCPNPVDTDLVNLNKTKAKSDSVEMQGYSDSSIQEHSAFAITRVISLLRVIGTATRDTHGGKFFDYAGVCLPW